MNFGQKKTKKSLIRVNLITEIDLLQTLQTAQAVCSSKTAASKAQPGLPCKSGASASHEKELMFIIATRKA